ncbi:MAG: hypothetical protein KF768_05145 [Phycisphaeraceae bacterium]|nr:hypothetical protein [Phycisphaeraceae bacterium]
MDPGEDRLFQVRVSSRQSRSVRRVLEPDASAQTGTSEPLEDRGYNVLVRAVDAETAMAIMRSRGQKVLGVSEADREAVLALAGKENRPPSIALCYTCKYPLHDLPRVSADGDGSRTRTHSANVVICPECGAVNSGREAADFLHPHRRAHATVLRLIIYLLVGMAVVVTIVRSSL